MINQPAAPAETGTMFFSVYYRKQLERNPFGEKAPIFNKADFHYMGNHEAKNIDDLFGLLNAAGRANPLGSAEWQHLIRQGVTDHTSMSVGDVAVDYNTGEVFRCEMTGWTKLTETVGTR